MTIFALEQAVSNGCQPCITEVGSALMEVAALRDENERLQKEVEELRDCAADACNDVLMQLDARAAESTDMFTWGLCMKEKNEQLRTQLAEQFRELIAKEAERAARELECNNAQRQHTMQCAINKTDSQRILELTAQLAEAQDALQAAQRLFKEALPKFNWGASFLDANAIQLLNEVPAKVNAAIRAAKEEKNGA